MTLSPSPGPGWEALEQESQDSSTNNPSEDELDDADDGIDELSLTRKRKGTPHGEPLVKRARYTPPGPKRVENVNVAGDIIQSSFSQGSDASAASSKDVQLERSKLNNGVLVSGVSPTLFGQDIIAGENRNVQAGPSRLNANPITALKVRPKDYVSAARTKVKRRPKELAKSYESNIPAGPFYPNLSKHALSEGGTKGKGKSNDKLSEWGSKPDSWSESASAPVAKAKRSTQAPPKKPAPEAIIDLTSSPPPSQKIPGPHEVIELSSSDDSKEVEKPVLQRSSRARKDGQMARKRMPDMPKPKGVSDLVKEPRLKDVPTKPKPKPIAKVKPQIFELSDSDDNNVPAQPDESKRNGIGGDEVPLASTSKTSSLSEPLAISKPSSTSKTSSTSDTSSEIQTPFSKKTSSTSNTSGTSGTPPISKSIATHPDISTAAAIPRPSTRRESTGSMLSELVNECALGSRNNSPTSATDDVRGDDNTMDVDQDMDVNMEPPPSTSPPPPPPALPHAVPSQLEHLHQEVIITLPLPLPTPAKVLDNQIASTGPSSDPPFVQWPPSPYTPQLPAKPSTPTRMLSSAASPVSSPSSSALTPSRLGTSSVAKPSTLTSKTHRLSASAAFQKKIWSTPMQNATPAEPVPTEEPILPSALSPLTKTAVSTLSKGIDTPTPAGLSSSPEPALPPSLQKPPLPSSQKPALSSSSSSQKPALPSSSQRLVTAPPKPALPSSSQKLVTTPPIETSPSESMPIKLSHPHPTATQKPPLPRKGSLLQKSMTTQAPQPIAVPSTAHSPLQSTSTLLPIKPVPLTSVAMDQQPLSEHDGDSVRQVTPPPRRSDSVDMRPLDVALGIAILPSPTSSTSKVKAQPVSPALPRTSDGKRIGASSSGPSRRGQAHKKPVSTRQSGQQNLADMIIEAGKNNTMSVLFENGKGNTKEEAIDLTADDEPILTKRRARKPLLSAKVVEAPMHEPSAVSLPDLASEHDLSGAIDQSKLVMQWIQNAAAASKASSSGSTPLAPVVAPALATEAAPESSWSTTDELARRPFQPLPDKENVEPPQTSRLDSPSVQPPGEKSHDKVSEPSVEVQQHLPHNLVDEPSEGGPDLSSGMPALSNETDMVTFTSRSNLASVPAFPTRHSFPGRSPDYSRVTNIATSSGSEDSFMPPATPDLSDLVQPTLPHRAVSLGGLPTQNQELPAGLSIQGGHTELTSPLTTIEGAINGMHLGISTELQGKQRVLPEDHSDEEAAMEVDECQALLETRSVSSELDRVTSTLKGQELQQPLLESGRTTPGSSIIEPRRSSRRSSLGDQHSGVSDADLETDDYESSPPCRTPEDIPTPPEGKTYGGFPAITWKSFRQDPTNLERKCHLSSELPHHLQDHINSMSERIRMHETMREILECTILQNTTDEPDAPPIRVFNEIDAEPTPPWEFYYTNQMWHGKGVPPPDVTKLESCDCVGKCDPRSSKPCACLAKQRRYLQNETGDFQYDKAGKLKQADYPIFECNDLCGCDEECRNRVVQHGRNVQVNIAKTATKGWGVFAGSKKIPGGTFIGVYAGELLTNAEAEQRGKKYDQFGRTYLFDLDFYYLREQGGPQWETQYVVDAYHAGNFTRFLNHSCDPNSRLNACYVNESNIEKPLLTVFALRDIEPYEEICFSYGGEREGDEDEDEKEEGGEDDDSGPKSGAVYEGCRCGAKNCKGGSFF